MTDFLYDAGTNGFIVTPPNLMTAELNGLASAAEVVSSGVFSQTSFGNAIYGKVWFKAGGAFTPTGNPFLAGWWVNSTDGGTTFEKNATVLPRSPDFFIPLAAAAYASGDIVFAPSIIRLPAPSCKVMLQNNSGAALPATGNVLTVGPIAVKY